MITAKEARDLMPNEDILENYPEIEILIKNAAKIGNNRIEYTLISSHSTFYKVSNALEQLGYTVFRKEFYVDKMTYIIKSHLIISW